MKPQQAPTPSPRKPRKVFVVTGIVLAIAVAGAVLGGWLLANRNDVREARSAQLAVEAFAESLRTAEYLEAYGKLCDEVKARQTLGEFADEMLNRFAMRGYSFVEASAKTRDGVTRAEVTLRVTLGTGVEFDHTFRSVREGDAWKICT